MFFGTLGYQIWTLRNYCDANLIAKCYEILEKLLKINDVVWGFCGILFWMTMPVHSQQISQWVSEIFC